MADWWEYPEMKMPHDLQVKRRELEDTKVLNAQGKRIYRAPEPIGYVKPSHWRPYVVKRDG